VGKLFGTDGIRGRAGSFVTPQLAFRLGYYSADLLYRRFKDFNPRPASRPYIVVGKDCRLSSDALEAAVCAGAATAGANAYRLGVAPTPATAFATKALRACAGIMITASHNPIDDNGLKVFAFDGHKVSDELEAELERLLETEPALGKHDGISFGSCVDRPDLVEEYSKFLKSAVKTAVRALRVCVDCAHGATSLIGPRLLREVGFATVAINDDFDGHKINVACGSTDLAPLRAAVERERADFGMAFDGDGDRALFMDERGRVVDGDHVIGLLATLVPRYRGAKAVVVTQMSNLGLEEFLRERGVALMRSEVGDIKVLELMRSEGIDLGGEQSGHIIMHDLATTGDGILTALVFAKVIDEAGVPLSNLAARIPTYPQLLRNVPIPGNKEGWKNDPAVQRGIEAVRKKYGESVRLYVRASGTEPLIRILTEAKDEAVCRRANDEVAKLFEEWSRNSKGGSEG
jgi:phosphoglucosamine mutase